ncbi:MAG: YlxR family protein [Acidimicrobiia bacterium]
MSGTAVRTCVGCRRKAEQTELIRVARVGDRLVADRTAPGRGAWICRASTICFEDAAKRRGFERGLRAAVSPQEIAALRTLLFAPGGVDVKDSPAVISPGGDDRNPTKG